MKALILVGGFGTRLRPLTLSSPKPLVEFCNQAMVLHQIKALKGVGVTEVVLAVNYQPQTMATFLEKQQAELGIKITASQETEPMGTAGPIKLAEKHLNDGEPFFVLNSDVSCAFPFEQMIRFHKERGAEGTLLVTKVEDPSSFGVVLYDEDGRIRSFVEKPKHFVGNRINAGVYLLSPGVFDRIPMRPTSIEKEVFPPMANAGTLFCMELPGFWADVGKPKDYISGTSLFLGNLRATSPESLASGPNFHGNVLIDPTAQIGAGCRIGPDVVIGPRCVVENGVRLVRSTLLPGSRVKSHSWVSSSIIGWDSTVGEWARIENTSVLGEDVTIKNEVYVNGGVILPHKSVSEDISEPRIVM
eukprot:CAMPEP_0185834066 /NCGR_PEP_ID=MMETSP1353-20130828/4219_1 /TAXON_ID=1077150 /ORGANISM="Erythrolobus australicus, Strain CCMP3124" /LENGTH=358 /DNA_ID=CAMNT_0028532419 /DNA_START=1 /DNA_END=1077 /DNA_ORIENTATION=-